MFSAPSPTASPSIGVILCSSRQPRACPQVAAFVMETFEQWTSSSESPPTSPPATLSVIDLAKWDLPFFNEPTMPSQVTDPADYIQPHTRAWSREIQKHAGLIFILPQYNWGYPAVAKNAIDYLYHEWQDKPAVIVSYGGHGGGKSAAQMRQVLQGGVGMRVVERMPALAFPDRKTLAMAAAGEELECLGGGGSIWEGEREGVCKAIEELMALIEKI